MPIDAGRQLRPDVKVRDDMLERLPGPVVNGEVQLPDMQWLAVVSLQGKELNGLCVADRNLVSHDPSCSSKLDPVPFVKCFRVNSGCCH